MRPATLAATAESSPSTRPVSSTMLDGVDGPAKNSRQTTRPTIARAATAITGATFLLDAAWLESDASAARSSAILVSQVSRHLRALWTSGSIYAPVYETPFRTPRPPQGND